MKEGSTNDEIQLSRRYSVVIVAFIMCVGAILRAPLYLNHISLLLKNMYMEVSKIGEYDEEAAMARRF